MSHSGGAGYLTLWQRSIGAFLCMAEIHRSLFTALRQRKAQEGHRNYEVEPKDGALCWEPSRAFALKYQQLKLALE